MGSDPYQVARALQVAKQHRIEAAHLSAQPDPDAKAHGARLDDLADRNEDLDGNGDA